MIGDQIILGAAFSYRGFTIQEYTEDGSRFYAINKDNMEWRSEIKTMREAEKRIDEIHEGESHD